MKVNWLAFISLVFFNLVFVLGLAIGLYAVLASLWIVIGSFIISPLLLFVVNILRIQEFSMFQSVSSVLLFIAGVVLIPVCQRITRFIIKLSVNYIEYNKNAIIYTGIK